MTNQKYKCTERGQGAPVNSTLLTKVGNVLIFFEHMSSVDLILMHQCYTRRLTQDL